MMNVYVDGSCINSDDQSTHNKKGGIGVFWGPSSSDNVSEPMKGPPSSTGAELQAATRAIEIAKNKRYSSLNIYTDSETVCTAAELFPQRSGNNWRKYDEYREKIVKICDRNNFEQLENALKQFPNVRFIHVTGHSSNQHNQQAHLLAREGAKMYRTGYY